MSLEEVTTPVLPLNELKLSMLGKIMLAAAACWVVGKAINMKVRGTPVQVNAMANALMASRRFREELSRPGASVESVMERLGLKNAAAQEFETVLGIPWRI